ncbi:hypothetical protein ACFVFJ_44510 [Streptomyces sp. NPDC057717]|uniref:hypothetical protein n=1 Tax=Streptomyces sp. NPDC057717 TaxID=3346224 RepID=UPI003699E698
MTEPTSGADERRVRSLLVHRGVGPDGQTPAPTPVRTADPDDWFERLYADEQTPVKPPKKAKPPKQKPKTSSEPVALPPGLRERTSSAWEHTRQVVAARVPKARLIRRDRVLYVAYNAVAAGIGWRLGLGPWLAQCLDYYIPRPGWGTAVLIVLAVATLAVDSRTHGLRGPGRHLLARLLGWAGRIPLATAVLAIALHNTH